MTKNKKTKNTKKLQIDASADNEDLCPEVSKVDQLVASLDNRDAVLQYEIKLIEGNSGEVISDVNGTITLSMLLSNILLPTAAGTYASTLDSMVTFPAKSDFRHYVDSRLKAIEEELRKVEEVLHMDVSPEDGLDDAIEDDSYVDLDLEVEVEDVPEEE